MASSNNNNLLRNLNDNTLSNFGGVFSLKPTAKYVSGARTTLKINGKLVGFAFSTSWNIATTYTEIRTVDNYLPHEYAPQHVSVSGSISMLHIPGVSATSELMQADVLGFLLHKYITIEVRDSATDELLFFTNKAVVTNKSERIGVDSLANVELQFKAIGWKDEREPESPKKMIDNTKGNGNESFLDRAADFLNDIEGKFNPF